MFKHTNMCPQQRSYIGRTPHNLKSIQQQGICSRFVLTSKTRQSRHKAAMRKLSVNL
jgi:hypothetical protein